MALKKKIYQGLARLSFNFGLVRVLNRPEIFLVESTNCCNLECIMCPYTKQTRSKGVMSYELFQKIVDNKWLSHSDFVRFHGMGEPLLNKELINMINYAGERGIKTEISTNICLLDSKRSERLLDSSLTQIIMSLDGVNPETYERVRKKANFKKSVDNIHKFLELKKKKQSNIWVVLQIICMEEMVEQINDFVEYWRSYDGVNEIRIRFVNDWAGNISNESGNNSKKRIYPCSLLWESVVIQYDGMVVPCCRDYDSKYILGDLKKQSLDEIWNGPAMLKLRREHLEGNYDNVLCKNCTDYSYVNPDITKFLMRGAMRVIGKKNVSNNNSFSEGLKQKLGSTLDNSSYSESQCEINIYLRAKNTQ